LCRSSETRIHCVAEAMRISASNGSKCGGHRRNVADLLGLREGFFIGARARTFEPNGHRDSRAGSWSSTACWPRY
jgi:hypothetical protein